MIKIKSNGPVWAGGQPQPIEKLYELFEKETLDPMFEEFHGYQAITHIGGYAFSGNFLSVSHVFSIWVDEDDLAVMHKLEALAQKNMLRPDYERQAYSMFANHTVVRTPRGKVLLSEDVLDCFQNGKKHRRLEMLGITKDNTTILGPRFSPSDVKRLAA